MAFPVKFYQFTKRENSTAVPGEPMSTYDCVLKAECSVIEPEIVLGVGLGWSPVNYNYARIDAFNRYYFVKNWTFSNAQWIASLQVDVLASFKAAIGASQQYVLRSAAEFDGNVIDNLYPTKTDITLQTNAAENPWEFFGDINDGQYVVGIINSDPNAVGSVSYFEMVPTAFNDLKQKLFAGTTWIGSDFGSNMTQDLLKAQFNPFQYIVSCKWFPGAAANPGSYVESIKYGWWELPVACTKLGSSPVKTITAQFNIPKHPDATTRGNYLNFAPFSKYLLNFPPFGTIPIDAAAIINSAVLYCTVLVDTISGAGLLYISPTSGGSNVINKVNANIGVPIQLAQMAVDNLGLAQTAITGFGNMFSAAEMGNGAGLITSAASGVISSIKASFPQMQTSGANGSIAEYFKAPQLCAQFFKQVDEANVHRGRPLCKDRTISSIPGYILVADADMSLQATQEENLKVKSYMEGGFFYE
jgi:hypothetical protein